MIDFFFTFSECGLSQTDQNGKFQTPSTPRKMITGEISFQILAQDNNYALLFIPHRKNVAN